MLKRKGQNIAEYSILITLIIIAAVGMQTYVKRGLSGRIKNVVDHTGGDIGGLGFGPGAESVLTLTAGKQYTPYYEESDTTVESKASHNAAILERGSFNKNAIVETAKVSAETGAVAGSETTKSTASAD